MTSSFDVAVVGAGIVGLAHAWMAARRGLRVALFERHAAARGASVRNFGMIWPIGQSPGQRHDLARRSRELWDEIIAATGLWCRRCGSLHLAFREDEWTVMQEFCDRHGRECETRLLTPDRIREIAPAARTDGLRGGLYGRLEIGVSSPEALAAIPRWLHEQLDVQVMWSTPVRQVSASTVTAADGRTWSAERIVVAGGTELAALCPDSVRRLQLSHCRLQMLKTEPQPNGWDAGPLIAGGLSLQHYPAFSDCPGLPALKQRIQHETPELNRFGIHLLAAQNQHGEVILGDSHEYGETVSVFDRVEIDELILREARRMLNLPSFRITHRWHGEYVVFPDPACSIDRPEPGIVVAVAPGGAGMTLAFAEAEQFWQSDAAW